MHAKVCRPSVPADCNAYGTHAGMQRANVCTPNSEIWHCRMALWHVCACGSRLDGLDDMHERHRLGRSDCFHMQQPAHCAHARPWVSARPLWCTPKNNEKRKLAVYLAVAKLRCNQTAKEPAISFAGSRGAAKPGAAALAVMCSFVRLTQARGAVLHAPNRSISKAPTPRKRRGTTKDLAELHTETKPCFLGCLLTKPAGRGQARRRGRQEHF